MIPMTTDHTFTLGQAAATGRSESTISKALKTGTLSARLTIIRPVMMKRLAAPLRSVTP